MRFLPRIAPPMVVLVACLAMAADAAPMEDARFDVTEAMIPMRDGVRLHTRVFRPKGRDGDLPFIFKRTPYGVAGSERDFTAYFKALVDEGYLFVYEDLRGRFGSEGTFVMSASRHAPPGAAEARSTRGRTRTTRSTGC